MSAVVQRPLRGARISSFYPVKSLPSLASLDSAFQLQEYISLLIRLDVHDVDRIVNLPEKPRNGDADGEKKTDASVDQYCWLYEQLRRLAQDLTHPLCTMLQLECNRQTCPEMKAGEWLYLCVAHGNDGAMEQCCAIDYILHTIDSATALLNSPRAFPSRLQVPASSHRHFPALARRLGRIFAHAYFHHREAFEQAEAESSLYARFLALTQKFDLVPAEFLVIPPRADAEAEVEPPRVLPPRSHHEPLGVETGARARSPPGLGGSESPRKYGRNRTDTMVFSEAASVAEELSKSEHADVQTVRLHEVPQATAVPMEEDYDDASHAQETIEDTTTADEAGGDSPEEDPFADEHAAPSHDEGTSAPQNATHDPTQTEEPTASHDEHTDIATSSAPPLDDKAHTEPPAEQEPLPVPSPTLGPEEPAEGPLEAPTPAPEADPIMPLEDEPRADEIEEVEQPSVSEEREQPAPEHSAAPEELEQRAASPEQEPPAAADHSEAAEAEEEMSAPAEGLEQDEASPAPQTDEVEASKAESEEASDSKEDGPTTKEVASDKSEETTAPRPPASDASQDVPLADETAPSTYAAVAAEGAEHAEGGQAAHGEEGASVAHGEKDGQAAHEEGAAAAKEDGEPAQEDGARESSEVAKDGSTTAE
ncbi:Mob1/phocein [Schizophyllum fasciatum]